MGPATVFSGFAASRRRLPAFFQIRRPHAADIFTPSASFHAELSASAFLSRDDRAADEPLSVFIT